MSVAQFQEVKSQPQGDVIAELEYALEMARQGELRSIAMVGEMKGGSTFTAFATDNLPREIGMASFLHHSLCAKLMEC